MAVNRNQLKREIERERERERERDYACVRESVCVCARVTNVAAQWPQVEERIEDFCLNWCSHIRSNNITPCNFLPNCHSLTPKQVRECP